MDSHELRSAWLGAGIALLLTVIAGFVTGGGIVKDSAPAAQEREASTPTLDPVLQTPQGGTAAAPAQPQPQERQ